ncbi:hypothetical protein JR316_0008495 [Psilocybe cubensis]|uniref:HAUS augmin-like complex subunit 6 N-terminal domain-containing protein n=2 Tax=Psilocybe cubensis TaxID=181762 RepID=A0A8H7XMF1_PSICU|nr:hypothetical protein JR316_0008495 [Psilocybe cubensis]KAH9479899.1 hypothetical protein JR316_0008495 [Psilocybe cubensis]
MSLVSGTALSVTPHPDVVALPIPLILLVHLHILEYPLANNPEYDHQIFNPRTRGLRERTKVMEDILSTYPCTQPSESLAFRTSLSKYLEILRHQSIFTPSARSGMKAGPSANSVAIAEPSNAFWWKEVVVRKSLLEECFGEKFERLILSLSTHALMKVSGSIVSDQISVSLQTLPFTYTASLAAYQASIHTWKKQASLLTKSANDLQVLRNSLCGNMDSKYSAIPTDKLKALADSKLEELLQRYWVGEEGKHLLSFLVLLAGIKSARAPSIVNMNLSDQPSAKPTGPPPPLPVAAAHHPSHLKRLRRPVFQVKVKSNVGPVGNISSKAHAEIMLSEYRETERLMRLNLLDALTQTRKIGSELRGKFESILAPSIAPSNLFWTPPEFSMTLTFVDPVPGKELLSSLGLTSEYEALDVEEDTLEKKIEHIRTVVLPPYPAIPDQCTPLKPALDDRKEGERLKVQTSLNQHARSTMDSACPLSSSSLSELSEVHLPDPPQILPGKSSRSNRLQSIHFSLARKRTQRTSSSNDPLDDEVDRLVDETNDFPTDDENTDEEGYGFSPLKTPKSKSKPVVNRIWTAGTPTRGKRHGLGQGTPIPRIPSAITRSLEMAFGGIHDESVPANDDENSWDVDNTEATPRPIRPNLPPRKDNSNIDLNGHKDEDEDVFYDDPSSMTLKEILLTAGASHFDLLDATTNDELNEAMEEDTSFVWE